MYVARDNHSSRPCKCGRWPIGGSTSSVNVIGGPYQQCKCGPTSSANVAPRAVQRWPHQQCKDLAKDNRDSGDHRAVISEMARHMGAGWSQWLICPRWTTTRYQNAVICAKCIFVIYMNYNFI